MVCGYGLILNGSGKSPAVITCEHGNEPLVGLLVGAVYLYHNGGRILPLFHFCIYKV
jgi:hypothetical protein